ncbi:hypothetical protein PILCRDRAFT_408014 [Piloderma croceum F 1598]|uniref:Uncharacterized protein n=1 Tax=Piloderma croceum (strain F 1598) TaxID=765440 RepID=A0A0C3C3X8_PILCF|nr:hypothetical protein PILCRDRAFT_408014 [Piloderma croceum F 1598]
MAVVMLYTKRVDNEYSLHNPHGYRLSASRCANFLFMWNTLAGNLRSDILGWGLYGFGVTQQEARSSSTTCVWLFKFHSGKDSSLTHVRCALVAYARRFTLLPSEMNDGVLHIPPTDKERERNVKFDEHVLGSLWRNISPQGFRYTGSFECAVGQS